MLGRYPDAAVSRFGMRLLTGLRAHSGLVLLLAIAAAERLAFLRWWRAFPGGDTYNFILIAQEILKGSYPVAEKRLPVYPALIALTRSFLEWEHAAVVVAFLSSLVAIVLLYALGRTLGLSKVALLVALAPFQAVAPFLFQSVRGYADTLFVAVALGLSLVLLRATGNLGALGTGLLLGAAALTRPEGVALFPVVLLIHLWRAPFRLGPIVAGTAIAVLPFLILSARSGRPLTPVEYFKDADVTTFGVTSVKEFARNYAALWTSVGVDRLWGEPIRVARDAVRTRLPDVAARLKSLVSDPKEAPSLLALVGIVTLVRRQWRRMLVVVLPFLAIAGLIAWWGVRQRFLVALYPLFFLLLAAGAHAFLESRIGRIGRIGLIGPLGLLLLALSLGPWRWHTAAEAREVQQKNLGRDYAYYQAIQFAKALPGRLAFDHRSSIALALFGEIDNRGRAAFADVHFNTPDAAEQWRELQRLEIRYIVIQETAREIFPVLSDPRFSDRVRVHQQFEYPEQRGTDRAALYEVNTGLPPLDHELGVER